MKRNKTNRRVGRSGKSPYAKYGKTPHRYSEAYYRWRRGAERAA